MSNNDEQKNQHLEPRVAKLEVGLERLTEDVRSLALIVRDQGSNVEKQLNELTIAVTQAAGPKKTDWSTIIAGIALIMAIGSAVFFPLNQMVQENKVLAEQLRQEINDHKQLPLHPVGTTLVQRLENQLGDHINSNKREMENHLQSEKELRDILTASVNEKIELCKKLYSLEMSDLKEKVELYNEKLFARIVKIEEQNRNNVDRDVNELQMWRLRAMKLNEDIINKNNTSDPIKK